MVREGQAGREQGKQNPLSSLFFLRARVEGWGGSDYNPALLKLFVNEMERMTLTVSRQKE